MLRIAERISTRSLPVPGSEGLISKHFIWSDNGWAGGVYQWQTLEDARGFYGGPWREGIVGEHGFSEPDFVERSTGGRCRRRIDAVVASVYLEGN
jgi:hypothetical protein